MTDNPTPGDQGDKTIAILNDKTIAVNDIGIEMAHKEPQLMVNDINNNDEEPIESSRALIQKEDNVTNKINAADMLATPNPDENYDSGYNKANIIDAVGIIEPDMKDNGKYGYSDEGSDAMMNVRKVQDNPLENKFMFRKQSIKYLDDEYQSTIKYK